MPRFPEFLFVKLYTMYSEEDRLALEDLAYQCPPVSDNIGRGHTLGTQVLVIAHYSFCLNITLLSSCASPRYTHVESEGRD